MAGRTAVTAVACGGQILTAHDGQIRAGIRAARRLAVAFLIPGSPGAYRPAPDGGPARSRPGARCVPSRNSCYAPVPGTKTSARPWFRRRSHC
jgi:hypothetical protein